MLHAPPRPFALVFAALMLASCAIGVGADDPDAARDAGRPRDVTTMDIGPSHCATSATCPGATVCDTSTGRCVECLATSDHCAHGSYCDATTQRCVAGCRTDVDCRPVALDGGVSHDGAVAAYVPNGICLDTAKRCVDCTRDSQCPPGQLCHSTQCLPGCSSAHPCGPGSSCCNGACQDTQSDVHACGFCGHACATTDTACCTGACTNTFGDVTNCGACGHACATPNATSRCDLGACAIESCLPGFGDANGVVADGCECATGDTHGSCASPADLGTLAAGGMVTFTGALGAVGSEHYVLVHFADDGSPAISITSSAGTPVLFDVITACDAAVTVACPDRPDGASNVAFWEMVSPADERSLRNDAVPVPTIVRVHAGASSRSCASFTLVVSN